MAKEAGEATVASIPKDVTQEDINAALEMLKKKRERDATRQAKIASGELVPKKYKTKPWSELSEEQKQKRKDYSKKWSARQRELAKIAKEHGLDKELTNQAAG